MRLETYIKNFNMHDAEDLYISIVVAWEQGQKLVQIKTQYQTQIGKQPKCSTSTFIKKVIQTYGLNGLKTSLKQRREYWQKNSLWEFANNLRKQLYKEIPQFTLIDYNTHKLKNYNEDDLFFKHFTRTNITNYNAQKSMALKRGIGWEFKSFEEWLLWWLQTGKFDQRGVTNEGYQMCRIGATGPYSPNNCYCATGKKNKDHYHLKKKLSL
tara:strand:- start:1322 stop:1954 length:633 start_codon:yes stop_codon:yes gene_type:complete